MRGRVAALLEKARDQLRNKEKAKQLVIESEREDLDPAMARTGLIED